MKAEIFRGEAKLDRNFDVYYAGDWFWHLRASNGQIVCQSEGYTRRSDAKRALIRFIAAVQKLELE